MNVVVPSLVVAYCTYIRVPESHLPDLPVLSLLVHHAELCAVLLPLVVVLDQAASGLGRQLQEDHGEKVFRGIWRCVGD